ncbi:MAG TPA: hypothetical protein VN380_24465 [Thermoanaerobaculia bacterium]|jgi:hypothetical protein|nr:hypothetical protein [Thermoanaerobaculia bacterium]
MTVKLPPAFGITQPQITIFNPSGTSATLTKCLSPRLGSRLRQRGAGARRGIDDQPENPNGDSAQLSNAFHYRWPDPGCGTTRHRGAAHEHSFSRVPLPET